jgi:ribosomal-protein-alanine N-acetyltransferase
VSDVVVGEAGSVDAAAIGAFMLAAWRMAGPDALGYSGATEDVMAEITTEAAVAARIAPPERRMFVARHDGAVVGFAATRHLRDDEVELAGIIVAPDMAGRGIGSELFDAALATAREGGYRKMVVRTETDNDPAVAFYEKHGFVKKQEIIQEVEGTKIAVWELTRDL